MEGQPRVPSPTDVTDDGWAPAAPYPTPMAPDAPRRWHDPRTHGPNPNLFYEVGVARTLGKPVALVARFMPTVPFDRRHHRVIVYDHASDGAKKLEAAQGKTPRSVIAVTEAP